MLAPVASSRHYVLVAISNASRGAMFQQVAGEALHLDVVVVRDGDEAVQVMTKRGAPSLLIVDLSLPRVDGFAVVRRLRRDASETDTRIVAVAAHETLRAAGQEVATSLGISRVLSLDIDRKALGDVLVEECATTVRRVAADGPATEPTVVGAHGIDADEVMARTLFEARRRFRMPAGIGYLRVGDEEKLIYQASTHGHEPPAAVTEITEVGFLRQVAETMEPLVVPLVETHPAFAPHLSKGTRPIRGFAAVPVPLSRSGACATICIADTRPVTLSAVDMDGLLGYGRSVGQELDRVLPAAPPREAAPVDALAEDVKTLQHLASTDPLTGLANRRGGERHIANEISRAKRERRPLSCILFDIDRFKEVNDTFGHQAGDQLLRDVSTLLRRSVRAYDILVRWGGEEFLLVLPGADLATARVLAERVRVAVESLDVEGIGRVTISAGAATFETDYDFAMTLRTADQRLYQAKAAGRNRVT